MAYLVELEEHPIRITARGEWRHGPSPLHPKVERLFRRNVTLGNDGNYILQIEFRRAPLEVEDTAFFVQSMRLKEGREGLAEVELLISDEQWEPLDPRTLMQSPDHVLYCRIRRQNWAVPCRFQPQEYHELALHCDEDSQGCFLLLGGERYRIQPYRQDWLPL